ncbi:MAG: hypothetical protein JSR34_01465 [Proteobacteria bacterium]|nr:hypothetical protein [Pseudomonadota bacterium]
MSSTSIRVAGGADPQFSQTRWSLVLDLQHPRGDLAARSLYELSQRYWYPVYAYARRSGHGPGPANDLCLAFFAQLPAAVADADPRSRGRFRDFLLDRINVFLREDWRLALPLAVAQKLTAPFTLEQLEARLARDPDDSASPTAAYHRSFALEVLERSLHRLATEAAQSGRGEMFVLLQPYLTAEPVPGEYQELSKKLAIPPLVVAIAVKRLRQRFREIAEDELLETVSSPGDLAAERESLARLLGGSSA